MADLGPLLRQAGKWAAAKGRLLDVDLVTGALELRATYDDLNELQWPPGSVERLLLVTWPAYGPTPPDEQLLFQTLDTYWMFLRATGRLAARSAAPAELRKEAKRSLPRMAAAYDDPARHSQGRVLGDFGRSIGIDLEGAADIEDLQERLNRVQDAWNALSLDERRSLMPDPSPKSARGVNFTSDGQAFHASNPAWPELDEADFDGFDIEGGDLARSASCARSAPFVRECLALAAWVCPGREVTGTGVLRRHEARDVYDHLELREWEDAFHAVVFAGWPHRPRERPTWRNAGDCLALDRLWSACVAAGLIEVGRQRATSAAPPSDDAGWRDLALALVAALCLRIPNQVMEPLIGALLVPAVAGGTFPLDGVRAWWDSRCPDEIRDVVSRSDWQQDLDLCLFHVTDCGILTVTGDEVAITDLGRDFADVLAGLHESQLLGE